MPIVRRSRRLSNQTPPDHLATIALDQHVPGGFDYLDIPYPATEPPAGHPVAAAVIHDPLPSSQTLEYLSAFADQRELTPPDLHSQCRGRKGKNGNAPRPPNAFMLFRSDFWRFNKERIPERDHRQISRIAAHCWNSLDESRRIPYQERARQLKDEHAQLYPQHKYNLPAKERASKKAKKEWTGRRDLCGVIAPQVAQDAGAPKSPKTPGSSEGGSLDQVVEQKVSLKRPRPTLAAAVAERTSEGQSQPSQPPVKKRKRNLRKPSITIIPVSVLKSQVDPSCLSTSPASANKSPALTLPSSCDSPAVKVESLQDLILEAAPYTVAFEKEPTLSPSLMVAPQKIPFFEFEIPEMPASISPPFDYGQPVEYQVGSFDVLDQGLRISDGYELSKPNEGLDVSIFDSICDSLAASDGEFADWFRNPSDIMWCP